MISQRRKRENAPRDITLSSDELAHSYNYSCRLFTLFLSHQPLVERSEILIWRVRTSPSYSIALDLYDSWMICGLSWHFVTATANELCNRHKYTAFRIYGLRICKWYFWVFGQFVAGPIFPILEIIRCMV